MTVFYCIYNTNKTLEERSDDCLYCMYNTNKTLEERSDDCLYCKNPGF